MCTAVPDKETGTGHTCCKTDRSDQGRLVNVLFYNVAEKSS